ncbi:Structural maintenance of chromosomes protein 6 [Saguinus oedipus]|uniref:Structural maintenance of chromosomes protein 6 n=1 Tax=Saguinus oedipus TaxID=9490 RepID=A0ABQ9U4Q4_SAGOE|nr:Structural maintenance of chromosomes protein 6 [Saguinus oedipus]
MPVVIASSPDSQAFMWSFLQSVLNSSLPSSKLIRILRMSDPERGQTTLPFRPVTQEEEDDQS